MPATTIKLEADLVKKVAALKPKDESISGFVRELIEDTRRRKTRQLQVMYQQPLAELKAGARGCEGRWGSRGHFGEADRNYIMNRGNWFGWV